MEKFVDQNQPILIQNFDQIKFFSMNFEKKSILVHLVNAFSQKFSQNRQSGLIRFYLVVNALSHKENPF